MQSRRLESAPYVGDVSQSIEIAQNSVTIDENDVSVRRICLPDPRECQRVCPSPALDGTQMGFADFVGRDDESRVGNLVANPDPSRKQMIFVGRPRRPRNEGCSGGAKPLNR